MTGEGPTASDHRSIVLAITGASGAVYSVRLLQQLLVAGQSVHLTISTSGQQVIAQELGIQVDLKSPDLPALLRYRLPDHPSKTVPDKTVPDKTVPDKTVPDKNAPDKTGDAGPDDAAPDNWGVPDGMRPRYDHFSNFMAPIASGSFQTRGMVICPCSGSTLGAIVHGTGNNLVHRAAEVHLKEKRPLILVPRETPLSLVYLKNMEQASQAGAVVMPAMPGWYHGVQRLEDLVDFVVARILDQLGVEHTLARRWGSGP